MVGRILYDGTGLRPHGQEVQEDNIPVGGAFSPDTPIQASPLEISPSEGGELSGLHPAPLSELIPPEQLSQPFPVDPEPEQVPEPDTEQVPAADEPEPGTEPETFQGDTEQGQEEPSDAPEEQSPTETSPDSERAPTVPHDAGSAALAALGL